MGRKKQSNHRDNRLRNDIYFLGASVVRWSKTGAPCGIPSDLKAWCSIGSPYAGVLEIRYMLVPRGSNA